MDGPTTTGKPPPAGDKGRAGGLEQDVQALRTRILDRYFSGQTDLAVKGMVGSASRSLGSGVAGSSVALASSPATERTTAELRESGLGLSRGTDDGRVAGGALGSASQAPMASAIVSAASGAAEGGRSVTPAPTRTSASVRTEDDVRARRLADRFEQHALLEVSRKAGRIDAFIEVLEVLEAFILVYGKQGGHESDQARKTLRTNFERSSVWTVRVLSLRYYEFLIDLQFASADFSLNAIQRQQLVSALVEKLNVEVFRGKEKVICETGAVKLDENRHEVVGERGSGASPTYEPLSFGVGRDPGSVVELILVKASVEGRGS